MRKLLPSSPSLALLAGCGGDRRAAPTPRRPRRPRDARERPARGLLARACKDYYGERHTRADRRRERATSRPSTTSRRSPPRPALGRDDHADRHEHRRADASVTVTGVERGRRQGLHAVDLELDETPGITVYDSELTQRRRHLRRRQAAAGVAKGASAPCSNGLRRRSCASTSGAKDSGCLLFAADDAETPTRFQLALETVPVDAGGIWNLGLSAR